ncbi:MAG: sporulation protein YunB [Clostridiales bacterium]|jgi:sporulation protein YunB|nr:sporulation protein YunB [Clostridiales bacterium]
MAGKKGKQGKRAALVAILLVVGLVFTAVSALSNLNKTLLSMAEARAAQRALSEVNKALEEVMNKSLTYSDFVSVQYDASGAVSMLSANTILMNRIASDASRTAQANIDALAEQGIELPLGAALGTSVFSGKGPRVKFEILPVGTVHTNFVTEFETAGINQTRHKISLEATATVRIVIPTGAKLVTVRISALMAESILVGSVPDSFIQVGNTSDALNFAP